MAKPITCAEPGCLLPADTPVTTETQLKGFSSTRMYCRAHALAHVKKHGERGAHVVFEKIGKEAMTSSYPDVVLDFDRQPKETDEIIGLTKAPHPNDIRLPFEPPRDWQVPDSTTWERWTGTIGQGYDLVCLMKSDVLRLRQLLNGILDELQDAYAYGKIDALTVDDVQTTLRRLNHALDHTLY